MSIDSWYYDDSGHFAYLLLDCERDDLDTVCDELSELDVDPLLWGTSYRPASDGNQYKYYIRIQRRSDGTTRRDVEKALEACGVESSEPGSGVVEILRQILAVLRPFIDVIGNIQESVERLTETSVASAERLDGNLAKLSKQIRKNQLSVMDNVINAMREEFGSTEQLQTLQKELDQRRRVEDDYIKEIEGLEHENSALKDQNASLKSELSAEPSSRAGMDTLSPDAALYKAPRGRRSQASAIVSVFAACMPGAKLIRGSEDVLFFEYQDPCPAIKQIHDVIGRSDKSRGTKVKGAEGWIELRCTTGSDRDGRIYYRRSRTSVDFLVSRKDEQKRDIEFLARQ